MLLLAPFGRSAAINSKFFKRGKEEYAFSVDKETHHGKIRLCNWRFNLPTELSLITEKKRLIKVAVLHLQQNHMEDAGDVFVFLFPFWEARDLKVNKLTFQSQSGPSVQVYAVSQIILLIPPSL